MNTNQTTENTITEDLSYITFGTFTTYSGERRIYINGTAREKVYLTDGEGNATSKHLPGWACNSDALKGEGSKASLEDRKKKDLAAFTLARKALVARYGTEPTFDAVWTALTS